MKHSHSLINLAYKTGRRQNLQHLQYSQLSENKIMTVFSNQHVIQKMKRQHIDIFTITDFHIIFLNDNSYNIMK